MILFNSTLDIGMWIDHATTDVTGSLTITLLLILVFFLLVALLFRAPMILAGLLMLPLLMVFASFEGWGGVFYTILTIFGIIIGWQFAKIIMGWGR
jgi:hypothetical protein